VVHLHTRERGDVQAIAVASMAFLGVGSVHASVCSRTYTLDADFDEGVLVGVEHETVHDQLQLSEEPVTLPFIWVPNQGEGTVSKVNTETGDELSRYRVGPAGDFCSPSRTTVDLFGNCWVGSRALGTAVKIGLLEAGEWIDRNSNGLPDTSVDTNGDGTLPAQKRGFRCRRRASDLPKTRGPFLQEYVFLRTGASRLFRV